MECRGRHLMASTTSKHWTESDVPAQPGRLAVITGANTGLGLQTARVLAERGASVVLACRDLAKAKDAAASISPAGQGEVSTIELDLGSLDSIRATAAQLHDRYERLDLLINNAGLMMPPYGRTEDGFEQQFGVNHLGHFALTGLLLDRMMKVPGSRVVTLSSAGHRMGRIDFDNLQWERGGYQRSAAYGRSKLANLLFTYELQRRLAAAGADTLALAAHPGLSRTELVRYLPLWMRLGSYMIPNQSSAMGALPTLRAATDPAAAGGEYYGPAGRAETSGPAKRVESNARSHDAEVAARLWDESVRLTGVAYPF
jgi:NAD(P)-dependent dehydrogenase (short-subunit alcohol dehydrogenase family)